MHLKHITQELPGKIIYEGPAPGQNLHYFTDTFYCSQAKKSIEIPGKGAIINRISALLFSRLKALGIPSHFLRPINMRKSLMLSTIPVPIKVVVRTCALGTYAKNYGLNEGKIFDRPTLEFYALTSNSPLISENQILSFDWLSAEELEDLQTFIAQLTCFFRGLLSGIGFHLMETTFSIGKCHEEEEESMFVLIDELSPETFCVMDIETKECFGSHFILASSYEPCIHYQKIATRLGIYLGGPSLSRIIPFSSVSTNSTKKTLHPAS